LREQIKAQQKRWWHDKDSYVYFAQEQESDGRIKIGVACDPVKRLESLQIGNSRELKLVKTIGPMSRRDAVKEERRQHNLHSGYWIRGEWYSA